MNNVHTLQNFSFGEIKVQLFVPDISFVKQRYEVEKAKGATNGFPYWAKVWPAAIAMSSFLTEHSSFIQHKKVLELAAGLGLPSIVAASMAKEVCCSDYLQDAIDVIEQSVAVNNIHNVQCRLLNWHHLPNDLTADVLLLSDVNYEQEEFDVLYNVLQLFIKKGTTIILTTPQRLIAKSFISRLLNWVVYQQEMKVDDSTYISALVLK